MSWPWSELGLDGPAGLPAIRSAYARRLKSTHPEEDPEGFGRLHAAYQEARRLAKGPGPRPPGPDSPPPADGGGEFAWDYDRLLSQGEDRPPEERGDTWDFDRLLSREEDRPPPGKPEAPPLVWNYEALLREGEAERARRQSGTGGPAAASSKPKKRGRRAPWLVAAAVFLLLVNVGPHLVSGLFSALSSPQETHQLHHAAPQKPWPGRTLFSSGQEGEAASSPASPSSGTELLEDVMYLTSTLRRVYGRVFTVGFAPDGGGYAAAPADDPELLFRVTPQYDGPGRPTGIATNYTDMALCRTLGQFAQSHGLDLFYDEDWQDSQGPGPDDLDEPETYCLSFPLTGGEDLLRELCASLNDLMEEPAFLADPPSGQLRIGHGGYSLFYLRFTGGGGLNPEDLVLEYASQAVNSYLLYLITMGTDAAAFDLGEYAGALTRGTVTLEGEPYRLVYGMAHGNYSGITSSTAQADSYYYVSADFARIYCVPLPLAQGLRFSDGVPRDLGQFQPQETVDLPGGQRVTLFRYGV